MSWLIKRPAVVATLLAALLGLNLYQYFSPREVRPDLTREQIIDLFHFTWGGVFHNRWLGILTLQNPLDLWITQEILFETKPEVVVEAGTYHGGSALIWAMLLENMTPDARVVTIDIEDQREPLAKTHRLAREKVDFLLGSSTDPEIVAKVKELTEGKRVLLILDSLHTRDHVLAELEAYWPIVDVGGYILVQDTVVNGHPVAPEHGPGPWEAVEDFLESNDRFVIDKKRERFGLTNNRNGFLKRVR